MIIKCKMCGGDLHPTDNNTTCECEFCGTVQTIPMDDGEKKTNLFNRANRLRMNAEFDKASAVYESIAAEFPEEAEAYWGLCLCSYGIEYVDDPATGEKKPTCHRTLPTSIMEDSNFDQACEYADPIARRVYREEAKAIDQIQKDILSIVSSEQPYDAFICYKETAEEGGRTEDSVLAQEIYDALTDKGLKVFFARITLEDKLGQQYEPYIYAALSSARVMLAVGTKFEYYDAVWVKNEWMRFLSMMKTDKSKTLIPCYKGLDAYDMPREFKNLQAQDMNKLGWLQDLTRGVLKLCGKSDSGKGTTQVVSAASPTVQSLLDRGYIQLEDSQWNAAEKLFNDVLNIDPRNSNAYLGLALAGRKYKKKDQLAKDCALGRVIDDINFERAKQFAQGEENIWFNSLDTQTVDQNRFRAAFEERKKKRSSPARNLVKIFTPFTDIRIVALKSDGTVMTTCEDWNVSGWSDIIAISANDENVIGLKSNGTVVVDSIKKDKKWKVRGWSNIVAIDADSEKAVGLRTDGTVVSTDLVSPDNWRNIVAVFCAYGHVAGITADGSVFVTGKDNYCQEDVDSWSDIVTISMTDTHIVGLKSDGTVVAAGDKALGVCDVNNWLGVIDVFADYNITIGLRYDGTVLATGIDEDETGMLNVDDWTDIVDISTSGLRTYGIKSNGTIVAVGEACYVEPRYANQDELKWTDIVSVYTDYYFTMGVKSDGTVVAVGNKNDIVDGWRLFTDINTFEQERQNAKQRRQDDKKEEAKHRAELEEKKKTAESKIRELLQRSEEEASRYQQISQKRNKLLQETDSTRIMIKTAQKKLESDQYELDHLKGLFTGKRRSELEYSIEQGRKDLDNAQRRLAQIESDLKADDLEGVVSPNADTIFYEKAKIYYSYGLYKEAYSAFAQISGYSDVDDILQTDEHMIAARKEMLTAFQKGKIVTFGHYPQNDYHKPSAIEWIVMEVKDNKCLLVSKHSLDCKPYNDVDTSMTWEKCSLRHWLNNTFLRAAFSSTEQEAILLTSVDNGSDHIAPGCSTEGGNNTEDKVFLLSYKEAEKLYFDNNDDRMCTPTDFAISEGASTYDDEQIVDGRGTGSWWLRSPGAKQNYADMIACYGGSYAHCEINQKMHGVRPVIWIDLKAGMTGLCEEAHSELSLESETLFKDDRKTKRMLLSTKGSIVTFGRYIQNSNADAEPEPIEWIVLDFDDKKSLLLSKCALDIKPYFSAPEGTDYMAMCTDWEKCTLREWLNNGFLQTAFTTKEQKAIFSTTVDNASYQNMGEPDWMTGSSNDTQDKVFLLSRYEVFKQYFTDDEARSYKATDYVKTVKNVPYPECWLRSPGNVPFVASVLGDDGYESFAPVNKQNVGVRPAIWVDINLGVL